MKVQSSFSGAQEQLFSTEKPCADSQHEAPQHSTLSFWFSKPKSSTTREKVGIYFRWKLQKEWLRACGRAMSKPESDNPSSACPFTSSKHDPANH